MDFRDDVRGQPVVIGALLIFAILILSFSAYQAFSVPNQNAQVEVEHFQDVEDQFSELRTSMINAVGSDERRSTSFKLGTRYPTRIIALNPPPAAGRLQTTDTAEVSIVEAGSTMNVCSTAGVTPTSRSLVYTPGYNEYREAGNISYENRLISSQFDQGAVYDQRLVQSESPNDRISLFLLTGEVDENGVSAFSLEVNGSTRHTETLTDPVITIPSSFAAETWNDEILDGRSDVTAAPDPTNDERVILTFTGGDYEVSCAVVGLDGDPAFTPPGPGSMSGGSGNNSTKRNPNPASGIRLDSVSEFGGTFTLTFNNTRSTDVAATGARINFVHTTSVGSPPTEADISPGATTLYVGGEFESLNSNISFTPGDTDVTVDFDRNVGPNGFFVMTMEFDNGNVRQYFVSDGYSTGGSGGGGP